MTAADGLIPAERWGRARLEGLSPGERELYHWILRSFAAGGAPDPLAVAEEAARLGLELESAFAKLAAEDLVHRDADGGEIAVAYPFSGRPTAHLVRLDLEREVYAMCAIDALGIPFMLATPAEILSRDPVGGEEVWVRVDPGEGSWWEPEGAVVVAAALSGSGPSAASCCAFVNFFRSRGEAERFLADRAELRGSVLSLPEAIEAGRTVFGDVLAEG